MATKRAPRTDVPQQLAALAGRTPKARRAAAGALGSSGDPSVVGALVERLAVEGDVNVILAIVGALGRFPTPEAASALVAVMRRPRERDVVAGSAAAALGSMGEVGAAAALACLGDGRPVADHAVRALGVTRSPSAVAPLAALLRTTAASSTRRAVFVALGRIDDERATAVLIDALRAGDEAKLVEVSLMQQGARGATAVAPLLREGGETAVRAAYALSLGTPPPEAAPDLAALLLRRDATPWAIVALAKTDGGVEQTLTTVGVLRDALGGRDADRAYAAARTLAWLARERPEGLDDGVVEALLGALALPAHETRARVSEALVALAPRGEEGLVARLRSEDAGERQAAVAALAQRVSVPTRATVDLAGLLGDEACAVWAAEALRRIGPVARAAVERVAGRGGEVAVRAGRLLAQWG